MIAKMRRFRFCESTNLQICESSEPRKTRSHASSPPRFDTSHYAFSHIFSDSTPSSLGYSIIVLVPCHLPYLFPFLPFLLSPHLTHCSAPRILYDCDTASFPSKKMSHHLQTLNFRKRFNYGPTTQNADAATESCCQKNNSQSRFAGRSLSRNTHFSPRCSTFGVSKRGPVCARTLVARNTTQSPVKMGHFVIFMCLPSVTVFYTQNRSTN